jgi:hypothetical protein
MSTEEPVKADFEALMHIMVIGFHHKKGCQLEYAYPKLSRTDGNDDGLQLPNNWKHLPSLALPDGSHNHDSDFVYFHLVDDSSEIPLQKHEVNITKMPRLLEDMLIKVFFFPLI